MSKANGKTAHIPEKGYVQSRDKRSVCCGHGDCNDCDGMPRTPANTAKRMADSVKNCNSNCA